MRRSSPSLSRRSIHCRLANHLGARGLGLRKAAAERAAAEMKKIMDATE